MKKSLKRDVQSVGIKKNIGKHVCVNAASIKMLNMDANR